MTYLPFGLLDFSRLLRPQLAESEGCQLRPIADIQLI
jgi:hypothetical protein